MSRALFVSVKAIIHYIDDNKYQEFDFKDKTISVRFKLELWDFHYKRHKFVLHVEYAIVDSGGKWSLIEYNQNVEEEKYNIIKMHRLF